MKTLLVSWLLLSLAPQLAQAQTAPEIFYQFGSFTQNQNGTQFLSTTYVAWKYGGQRPDSGDFKIVFRGAPDSGDWWDIAVISLDDTDWNLVGGSWRAVVTYARVVPVPQRATTVYEVEGQLLAPDVEISSTGVNQLFKNE